MTNKGYKIGLMGSSCSGKTTSAGILATELRLELYPEFESVMLAEWIKQGKVTDKTRMPPNVTKEFHESALRLRETKSSNSRGYVSDRTAADLLVYNRIYVQPHFPESYGAEFTARCKAIMERYTHLFLFPRGVLPLEANGIRTVDSDYQLRVHTKLLEVLGDLRISYVSLSKERLSKQDRVEEIKSWLEI